MILNKIKEFIIQNNLIKSGDNIICAMSGGIDSTFLFFILYKLSNYIKFNLSACHINHCLRKESSYNDMHFIQKICNNNKIHLDYKIIDTINFCKKKNILLNLAQEKLGIISLMNY